MDKAYYPTIWENRPAETSPLDEINLNAISRGLNTVDDRAIDLDARVKNTINGITFNQNTGVLRFLKDDGTDYDYNLNIKILGVIDDIQRQNRVSFSEIAVNFEDVRTLLDDMDMKIDMTAEGANAGLRDVQTTVEENDGYYRREMSGIRDTVSSVSGNVNALDRYMTEYSSSITQTTQAIQLQVQEVTQSVDDLGNSVNDNMTILRSQINQTAGQISLKVSKLEVIDDLQQEFAGSGISITTDRITFASTGSMVVNTTNFKLDEEGNAEFQGHVAMDSGSVGGVPIEPSPSDFDSTLSIKHSHHSWKLRSAALSGTDERYYTYMTANKHLIVSNDEDHGHNANNDVTGNCTIGSKSYPWKAGYFDHLYVKKRNVIPDALRVTLPVNDWQREGSYYFQSIRINGVSELGTMCFLAYDDWYTLSVAYEESLNVACISNNYVKFLIWTKPSDDMEVILIVEDYILADTLEPSVLNAEYFAEYSCETPSGKSQYLESLVCSWDSPLDDSRFLTWDGETLVIEKWNEETEQWESYQTFPIDEPSFDKDEFSDSKLIIGLPDK